MNHYEATSLIAENITFNYGTKTIFHDNNFSLNILNSDPNKLFGIIGPSGVGKTTFISILGGQIRPSSGYVKINDIDIYSVDDSVRRKLIAMQGQVSTTLKGSLRYNLTFGLSENVEFSDDYLITLLKNVGLWQLFENVDGLNSEISEAGASLSGGQKQRLNFANLYLRAKYFEPFVIFIDEPTSSLDEISERAITSMILELASKSVTFVIAHRLNTLEDAKAILDLSVEEPDNVLKLYTKDELMLKSNYYRELISGHEQL